MKAAVLTRIGGPLEVLSFSHEALDFGQVLVEIRASGLCGAQLQEIRGEKGNEKFIPHLMGHEGFGEVTEVGPGVTRVEPGDFVTLHWRETLGIAADFPSYQLEDGSKARGGRVTTLSSHSIVSENRVTQLPSSTPPELGALLGCAITTAFGVVQNDIDLAFGQSVAVLGCGGLGLALLSALSIRGAGKIIAVDIQESKQELALSFGAESFVPVLTEEVDVIVDTTGKEEVVEFAARHLSKTGTLVLLVNRPGSYRIPSENLFLGEGSVVRATQGGHSIPALDIPRLASFLEARPSLWRGLITHSFGLEEINEAVAVLNSGAAGRILIYP